MKAHVLQLVVLKFIVTVLGIECHLLVQETLFVLVFETKLHVKVQHISLIVLVITIQSKIGTCFLAHKNIISI